jgi:hypothetical protein
MKKLNVILLCGLFSFALSACQTISYESISSNVRNATTYESDKKEKVIGQKIQIKPAGSNSWYEAEKTASGEYKLTPSGKAAKLQDENPIDGGGGGC